MLLDRYNQGTYVRFDGGRLLIVSTSVSNQGRQFFKVEVEFILESVVKGTTKKLLAGIWTTYDFLDLQTEMLPSALG